jgi:hexosaminidase
VKNPSSDENIYRREARRGTRSRVLGGLLAATVMMSLAALPVRAQEENADPGAPQLIPAPVSMEATADVYAFRANSKVTVDPGHAGKRALPVAEWLASFLRTATGYPVPVAREGWGRQNQNARLGKSPRNVHLALTGDESQLGEEGYTLSVSDEGALLQAAAAEGLFRGSQTLRQLFPPEIESDSVQPGPWSLPGVNIVDYPRYEWRGAHLDVARHFLTVEEVKRYIDLLTLYKINRFHMHLSNDQGWRLWIDDWPNLALIGGSTEVGETPGGYYTKDEYRAIVQYAADRFITLIPEIDVPGHTNAAEVSYPELNSCRPGGVPSHRLLPGWEDEPFYTGTGVGFSALCVHDEITYEFMADVIREISEITPGPYFHVGGDEAFQTSLPDYIMFMDRIQDLVHDNGKTMMGWAEVARANAVPGSIAQNWSTATGGGSGGDLARTAVAKDMKVVMSPANRIYLDMKYAPGVPPNLGLTWAGTVEVMRSCDWNPGAHLTGVTDDNIIGVEAPLWTETIEDIKDAEMMSFPRLPGVGEIGWTPQQGRVWTEYRERLANQARRWAVMDINYYRSPQVDWVD